MQEIVFKYPSKMESFAEMRKIASKAENLFQTLRFIECEIKILEVNTEFATLEFTKVEGVNLYEMISQAALEITEFKNDANKKIETLDKLLEIFQNTKCDLYTVLDYSLAKLTKEKAEKITKLFPQTNYDKMTSSIITAINETMEMVDKGYILRAT